MSKKWIAVDDSMVEAVLDWKLPTSVFKIRSFLDLAGYYRRFIPDFATLAKPMTRLTQKGVKYEWSDSCKRVFQELKKRLTSALVLIITERDTSFQVYCDASKDGPTMYLCRTIKLSLMDLDNLGCMRRIILHTTWS